MASYRKNKIRPYRIGTPLSLFLLCSVPIFWLLFLEKSSEDLPYPPEGYLVMSIFGLCVATFSRTILVIPEYDLTSKKSKLERLSNFITTITLLMLTLIAVGKLPAEDPYLDRLALGGFYVLGIFNLFFTELLISLPRNESSLEGKVDEAMDTISILNRSLKYVGIPIVLGLIVTFLIYFLFRYEPSIPNHATVFAMLICVSFAIFYKYDQIKNKSNEND